MFQSNFDQNTNQEFSEVHCYVQLSQYFWNFAKRLERSDIKRLFGKVPVILAQFMKVVNFKKIPNLCFVQKLIEAYNMPVVIYVSQLTAYLEMFTKLHFFNTNHNFKAKNQ